MMCQYQKMETYKNPLVLNRSDLIRNSQTIGINDLILGDFQSPFRRFHESYVIVFVDDDGTSKVLKNRYGPRPDMDNEIEINITGYTGTGKTAFARLIQDYLLTLGIKEVNVFDDEEQDELSKGYLIQLLSILREKTKKINIRTTHTRRTF